MTPLFFAMVFAALGAMLARRPRLRLGEGALLLAMLALALYQQRQQSDLAIVAALVLVPALARTGGRPIAPLRHSRAQLAAAAALAAVLIIGRLAWPLVPAENKANPRHLVAAVPGELRAQPVLNGYTFGGPLILAGIRPYIDGRADMYGDEFFDDHRRIVDGDLPRFRRAVERYNIRWTILPAGNRGLLQALDRSPQWRRIYADPVGVIHVREAAGRPAAGQPRSIPVASSAPDEIATP
jgi:hypothetical protein